MVLTAAGCQRLPIARVAELTPLPPTRPKLAEPTPAPDPAPVLRPSPTTYPAPSLSATPTSPASQAPMVEVARKGSATPLLDRALVRAEALEHLDDDPPCDCDFECDVPEPSHMTPAASIAEPKVKPSAPAELAVKDRTETPAAPRPIDPERPAKVVTPSDLWRQDLERLRAMAHERAIGSPELAALQARLLDWIADPEAGNSPSGGPFSGRSPRPPAPIRPRTGRTRRRSARRSRRSRSRPRWRSPTSTSAARSMASEISMHSTRRPAGPANP